MLSRKLNKFIKKNSAKHYWGKDRYDKSVSLTITTKNSAWIEYGLSNNPFANDKQTQQQLITKMEARLTR